MSRKIHFRANIKYSGKDGTVIPERDSLSSEVGAYKACTTVASHQALYTVPTATPTKKLHISTLIMRAASTATTLITLYDSTSTTTPTVDFPLGVNEGAAITNIEGLIHSSYVYYRSDVVGATVRFGGKLRDKTKSE